MRVNVQLIDAQSGSHLWAERFEKPVTDLFEMQDEIVARIANTLNAQLIAVEARRADRTPTPDSMDLYFQGDGLGEQGGHLREHDEGARVLRARAGARSHQCRRAGRNRDGGRQMSRSAFSPTTGPRGSRRRKRLRLKALSLGPGARHRPSLPGHGARFHQPRGSEHRRIRTGSDAGSKHGRRPRVDRAEQTLHRARRGDRGACAGGPPPQSSRSMGLYLAGDRRSRQEPFSAARRRRSPGCVGRSSSTATIR